MHHSPGTMHLVPGTMHDIQGDFFTGTPLKVPSTEKLIWTRLGVSWPIYANVDSPNLGFPYFYLLGGYQRGTSEKHPVV